MEQIHIAREKERLGVFTLDQVREGLKTGQFLLDDLAWRDGMPSWTRLSLWPEFAPGEPDASHREPGLKLAQPIGGGESSGNAGGMAAAGTAVAGGGPSAAAGSAADGAEPGLPWENRAGGSFFEAVLETLKLVLFRPAEAFSVMRREGGLADPLAFVAILGSVGLLIGLFYNFGFQLLVPGATSTPGGADMAPAQALLGMALAVPLIPVFVVLGAFMGSGITHLCLMLLGGATRPFEATFRVTAYAYGSTSALQVVPFCGAMVFGIWNLVALIIGLAKVHEIPVWKSALAVFLPTIACCVGGGLVIAALFGVYGADALQQLQQLPQ